MIRQLVCRGDAGVHIAIDQDPSPRGPKLVVAAMTYRHNGVVPGVDYAALEPGACSWNPGGFDGIKAEPGIVRFDISRIGSSYDPDPSSLTAWLKDPAHRWVFYVDDATNLAASHGAFGGGPFQAPAGSTTTTTTTANLTRDRLRCRGGSGLDFDRRGPEGSNLVAMRLNYRVARRAAGPYGAGLQAATCAWAEHIGQAAEPGRVDFTVARPAVDSIQAYLTDESHYWTFVVLVANPDSAIRHQAWTPQPRPVAATPQAPDISSGPVGSKPAGSSGTSFSYPGGSGGGGTYTPGGSGSTFDPSQIYDIRNVQVTAGLEGVAIRFEAAANISPTVTIATSAPTGSSPDLAFGGTPVRLAVSGTPIDAGRWRYSAAAPAPLARGTQYWFIADAPASGNARHNQATGQFRTLQQRVTLGINQIDLLSDGDSDSEGELYFTAESCPDVIRGRFAGTAANQLSWSEGRHQVGTELVMAPGYSAPDRIRVFLIGIEDDGWMYSPAASTTPSDGSKHCEGSTGTLEPKSTARAEWNAAILDLDLTQYPGAKATQTFVRRSQPLANGSKVAFEVRGYIVVTRE
jgi:hypothetical protein